jgi:hypothetical protein
MRRHANPHIKIDEYSLAHLNNQIYRFLRMDRSSPGTCIQISDVRRDAPPRCAAASKMMSKALLTKTTVFMDYAKNISRSRAATFSTFTFEPRHGRLGL